MNNTTSILVVDDDPAILDIYSQILRAEGYEVWEASTGQEGLQAARARRPDLVLLDVMLPDLSGMEVCRQIKADPALLDVFVVLNSGGAISVAHKVDGLETGADEYLVKPLDPGEFLARLRTIVRLRNTTAALRASEQRHRRLVEILPEAVAMVDLQGRLLAVNPQGIKMLGHAGPGQLLERTIFDLTRPQDHARVRTDLATTLATGTLRNAEYTLLKKSGDPFLAEVSAAVAADGDGQPRGFVLVARDTTERKEAEEALQAQTLYLTNIARFLQTLMDAIPAPVYYNDVYGSYLGCNKAFEDYLGLSREQIIGKRVHDVIVKDLAEGYHQSDRDLLARPGVQTYESSVVHADGTRRQVIFNKATFQNAEGEVGGLIGVILDITEHKRAEEQIQLLADAVQSSQELICITDQDNRFTFANQAFLHAYGYTIGEILGKTPDLLYSAKNPSGLCNLIHQQTLRGGWKGEVVNCRRDGAEFPVSLNTSPIRNGKGRTLGLVGVATDISERRRAEQHNAALSHLGYRLSSANTREQAASIILDIGSELFGWDAGYVSLCSPAQDQITPLLTVDTVEGERVLFPPTSWPLAPSPMMRRVLKEGAALIEGCDRSAAVPRLVRFGNVKRSAASRMFVPIHAKGSVIGILSIQSYTPKAYSREDLKLLQTLADHCGDSLERIEIADALQQAEAKYRSIFENATEGIVQLTPEGRPLSANPALARILGYSTPEELVTSVTDLGGQHYVIPEQRQEVNRLLDAKGSVQGFETEVYRKDRSRVWVSINERVVQAADGKVLYYEGTIQDITERKQGEEQLRKLSRAVEQSPAAVVITDLQGNIEHVNAKFTQVTGYSLDEVRGQNPRILRSGETPPEEYARLWQTITGGREWRGEFHNRKKSGELFWEAASISPILDEAGRITHFVSVKEDINERKWVENLLRVQRDFGIFLSSSDDLRAAAGRLLRIALENEGLDCGAVYLVNAQTNSLEIAAHQGLSVGFAKRSSHFAVDPVRNSMAGAQQPASGAQAGSMVGIVQQLNREGLLALEVIPIQHSGQVVAVLNVGSRAHATIPAKTRHAIEALATQAGGAIARIRAEQSLRTGRQLLEKTLHSLRAAVFIEDAHATTILECNPAATRIFGHSREEMIGQSPALLHLNDTTREEFSRHLLASVKAKGLLGEFEFKMKRKDGSPFPAECTLAPIRNAAGQIVTWVGVVRDMTERKQIEQDLRHLSGRIIQAQEAERQRVARDLHDSVNQVLASAKMRLRKVEACVVLNPMARELLARCDELLVQALEENRRIAHNLRPTDLDALGLADACRNLCREFQARTNLVVQTRIARFTRRCPPATELNLFRIVQEVLNNIERHARAKTVRLQITFQPRGLMLRIQDDGRGFDPSAVKPARRKRGGIGLTNMQERAAILGGTCEVVSAPSRGTTITVRVSCPDH